MMIADYNWVNYEHSFGSKPCRFRIKLLVCQLGLKGAGRMYRRIRNREYLDPNKMYPGGFYSQMTRREAQLILGVMQTTEPSAIKLKHRTLMLNNHPDNGGSTYLATKINEAKDMLLSS